MLVYVDDTVGVVGGKRTDLVELKDVGLRAQLAEQALAGLAVRAVGLREDGCARKDGQFIARNAAENTGIHLPTELSSMICWALVFADMMVFGLAERAPEKKLRRKLMVGEREGVCVCCSCAEVQRTSRVDHRYARSEPRADSDEIPRC